MWLRCLRLTAQDTIEGVQTDTALILFHDLIGFRDNFVDQFILKVGWPVKHAIADIHLLAFYSRRNTLLLFG